MIGARLSHRITVFHPTGRDAMGALTGTTTTNIPASVEYASRLIQTAASEQKVSRAVITTRHHVQIGDIITLPDGTTQTTIDVRPVNGLGGRESHREVYL